MQLSIVIPLYNEEESLPELHAWIRRVVEQEGYDYEVIFVDDGSRDNSWKVVQQLAQENSRVKAIQFQRNYGKSAALNEGFQASQGDVVITMDADMQDSPDEIPELYNMIASGEYELVSGWKQKRFDPLTKTIPTKIYNGVTRFFTGIKLHDMNCGLKSYKRQVVKSVEIYGEMHRYIPVIAKRAGFSKIGEKVVQHRERQYGVTKFGMDRFINGFLDLLSILFVTRFSKKPMHFFGTMGLLVFFIGFIILMYLTISKFFFYGYGMTDRPIFYFGLVTIIIGVQLFLTGFLAELISRSSADRNDYLISQRIGY